MRKLFALIYLLALSAVTAILFSHYHDVLAKRLIPIEVPKLRRNGLLLQQLALTINLPQMPMKYSTTVNQVQSWTNAKPTKQLDLQAKEPPPNKDISPTSTITKAYKWTNVSLLLYLWVKLTVCVCVYSSSNCSTVAMRRKLTASIGF